MSIIKRVSKPVWFPLDPDKQGMWYGNFFVQDKKGVIHRLVYEVIEWKDMDTHFIYYDAQEIPSHMDLLWDICESYYKNDKSEKEVEELVELVIKGLRKQVSSCLTRYLENNRRSNYV